MKAVLVTIAMILAGTTVASAQSVERICWHKVTTKLANHGCSFGNDLSEASNRCENIRRKMYKKCLLQASAQRGIEPAPRVELGPSVRRIAE